MPDLGTGRAVFSLTCRLKGVSMIKSDVCRFLGKNDDYCDVGCGYVSPHDAYMMVRYCNGRYEGCAKYRELDDRIPGEVVAMSPFNSQLQAR